MKKTFASVAIATISLGFLTGCQQEPTVEAVSLETNEQKVSYGIGQNFANQFSQSGLTVDTAALKLGIEDVFASAEPKLTAEQFAEAMEELKAQQKAAFDTEADRNLAEGKAFLEENATKEGVVVTNSGLQYRIDVKGEGDIPTADDTVKVHYKGTLLDGTEFDSSHRRGQPAELRVSRVIAGWTEALQLMPVGSTYTLYIPSDLAYGLRGTRPNSPIGPNATLTFEVELIEIVKSGE